MLTIYYTINIVKYKVNSEKISVTSILLHIAHMPGYELTPIVYNQCACSCHFERSEAESRNLDSD